MCMKEYMMTSLWAQKIEAHITTFKILNKAPFKRSDGDSSTVLEEVIL